MELTEEEYSKLSEDDIAKRKKLRYREDILDNMGSVELGANIFRITQTEALLEKQQIPSEELVRLLEIQLKN